MGDWYWVGVCLGLGVALGIALTGVLGSSRSGLLGAIVLAVAGGAALGLVIDNWDEVVAGGLGGLAGAFGSAPLTRGALRTGGTRAGTATIIGLGALIVAAGAFVPLVGYLQALAAPAVGARLRRRAGRRFAGLRTLARD